MRQAAEVLLDEVDGVDEEPDPEELDDDVPVDEVPAELPLSVDLLSELVLPALALGVVLDDEPRLSVR